jgi:hypothetical protein
MNIEDRFRRKFVHRYRVYQLVLCVGRLCDVTVELSLFYNKILAVNPVFKKKPTIKRWLNGVTNG